MKNHETPENLVELLDGVVAAASRTPFYSRKLVGRPGIRDLAGFDDIPITPIGLLRRQRLADVITGPSPVERIAGPYKGQSAEAVPVVEGSDEAETSYRLFTDAVERWRSLSAMRTCAIVTSAEKRYFAAEIATMLIRSGVASHVFIEYGNQRTYERLHLSSPDLLVVLSEHLVEKELPDSIDLCITFRRSQRVERFPQLDIYVIDELGFLGHSSDCEEYTLNGSAYHFEISARGNLIVTALRNHIQPMLRIETADRVKYLGDHALKFATLSACA